MRLRIFQLLMFVAAVATLPIGCTNEESDLGVNLTDPNMLFEGKRDTMYADMGYSRLDTSLITSGLSFGIIGTYSDATFGTVHSTLFTQIALPKTQSAIDISTMTVDTVELVLMIDELYPDSTATYRMHFRVSQLAETLMTDSIYYGHSTLALSNEAPLFDEVVSVKATDTLVRLMLDTRIANYISRASTPEELIEQAHGLCIDIVDDGQGDRGMLSVNFASTQTRMRVRYHIDAERSVADFEVGAGANHFTQFTHDYAGTAFATADSVAGTQRLYMEPMAGHDVYLSFDQAVKDFHAAHPQAAIHNALLLLPVVESGEPSRPDLIVALRQSGGSTYYVDDYYSTGYDGQYDATTGCYRIRLSQHLQGLLRDGGDEGLRLILNSRASRAQRMVLAGTTGTTASDRVRIEFVYSE